jgi:ATP-dependent DNA ligase
MPKIATGVVLLSMLLTASPPPLLARARPGLRYVEHLEGDGALIFKLACKLGLECIVSKRLDSRYRSGRSRHWIKIKNPKAPAALRIEEATF